MIAKYLNIVIGPYYVNENEKQALKKPIINACIKSARKNGRSDAIGMLRGTLFLENEPLSLDILTERTGCNKPLYVPAWAIWKTLHWRDKL